MPMREAMEWVGHTSQAVHRAYAKNARTVCMPLEYYEEEQRRKIIQFDQAAANLPEAAPAAAPSFGIPQNPGTTFVTCS